MADLYEVRFVVDLEDSPTKYLALAVEADSPAEAIDVATGDAEQQRIVAPGCNVGEPVISTDLVSLFNLGAVSVDKVERS